MRVKELIEILNNESDKDIEIIMSKDGEGNGFSPLSDVSDQLYQPDSTWSGNAYNIDEKEEAGEDTKKVICFWPTN